MHKTIIRQYIRIGVCWTCALKRKNIFSPSLNTESPPKPIFNVLSYNCLIHCLIIVL